MSRFRTALYRWLSVAAGVAVTAIAAAPFVPRHAAEAAAVIPPAIEDQVATRRINEGEYRRIIGAVFGTDIAVGGHFEPELRDGGLMAVGAAKLSVTSSGLAAYDAIARSIAAQVIDEAHRDVLVPCKPKSADAPDDKCAAAFFADAGHLLYRRPLTKDELAIQVTTARDAAETLKDFYSGIGTSLANMLISPNFLFRKEMVEADPRNPGQYRLTSYAMASRLSFLLWDTAPDDVLLTAAEKGELYSSKGVARQVDRMMSSPRFRDGARAFFADMLNFDDFATLTKDTKIYPKFSERLSEDAQEQTLRTIVDLLLTQHGDYRDLFTTRRTFLTPLLGALYGVPVEDQTPNGLPARWMPYEYPKGDPRVGILTQASFVALHSQEGRTSPTQRGKALREIILCQKVPPPPGNVDFTVLQDTSNPVYKTARERLIAHRTAPVCAGCHKITDPTGLALENFDSVAGFRTTENGASIDTSGDLDGVKFTDAAGLGQAIHDNPATSVCLVNRMFSYAVGRSPRRDEADLVKSLVKHFGDNGYRLPELIRQIATHPSFSRVVLPAESKLPAPPVSD